MVVTALNARVSQASQVMEWERVEVSAVESGEGYRILASCVGGVWCYSAFGPEEKIVKRNDAYFFRGVEYKDRYEVGEQVPPSYSYRTMTACYPVGVFRADCYGGADAALAAAKDACVLDCVEQLEK